MNIENLNTKQILPSMVIESLVKIFQLNDINIDLKQMSKKILIDEKKEIIEYKDSLESDHEEEH